MDLYFNPYPAPAKSHSDGLARVIGAADALFRLNKQVKTEMEAVWEQDRPLSSFVLVWAENVNYYFRDMFRFAKKEEIDKLRLLLEMFSKGRNIDATQTDAEMEYWIVEGLGVNAPLLGIAAKQNAMALTVPTSPGWDVDYITFEGRANSLHNLWGQPNIAKLKEHCVNSLRNAYERFAARYEAVYCENALKDAPDERLWDQYCFFKSMDKAAERHYKVDNHLIKDVGSTKYGRLYELRCYESGWRIFFVCRKNFDEKMLIAGFYPKSSSTSQRQEIQEACVRVNNMDFE